MKDMSFEPQKFFIGLMDFFSILLPGALLTYLLKDQVGPLFLGSSYPQLKSTEGGFVFLFSSYLLGHFIFLIGAWLDELYDIFCKYTLNTQIRELAWNDKLLPECKLLRFLLWMAFKGERNQAVEAAKKIKRQYMDSLQADSAVNTFQWAKLHLAEEHPAALATVQRFEADSKFFRSLVVVLLLLLFFAGDWWHSFKFVAIGVFLLLLAFWRYIEQRHKATNQAYWSIITLEGQLHAEQVGNNTKQANADPRHADKPTHAGGIVYRKRKDRVEYLRVQAAKKPSEWEYLLVQATENPSEWVLPKGKVEPGEHTRETAVREVREETGVWAKIKGDLKIHNWPEKSNDGQVTYKSIKVQLYLMEPIEELLWTTGPRRHKWITREEAKNQNLNLFDETKSLLIHVDDTQELLKKAEKE